MNLIILKSYSDYSYVCLFTANRTNSHLFFSLLVIEFVHINHIADSISSYSKSCDKFVDFKRLDEFKY